MKSGAAIATGSMPNMHGYDWVALREQYKPLLKYVAHRSDLNYVIAEMISELTIQHAYVEGGDFQIPPRPRVGLPGARFELDKASGRYRISKIFEGENEEDIYRSPLTGDWRECEASAITSWRSTARSLKATTIRIDCCATRPTIRCR